MGLKITKFNPYELAMESVPKPNRLYLYQKLLLRVLCGRNVTRMIHIKGDAWTCTLKPSNVINQAVLNLKDYYENGILESEIAIQFTKDEMDEFIDCLKIIRKSMN